MKLLNKILFSLLIPFFLSSCGEQKTYFYLMTHPQELQKTIKHCEESGSFDNPCEIARKAANDFSEKSRVHDEDPEKFGQQILMLQQELAQKNLSNEKVLELSQQLDIMLAVVAVRTF